MINSGTKILNYNRKMGWGSSVGSYIVLKVSCKEENRDTE